MDIYIYIYIGHYKTYNRHRHNRHHIDITDTIYVFNYTISPIDNRTSRIENIMTETISTESLLIKLGQKFPQYDWLTGSMPVPHADKLQGAEPKPHQAFQYTDRKTGEVLNGIYLPVHKDEWTETDVYNILNIMATSIENYKTHQKAGQ